MWAGKPSSRAGWSSGCISLWSALSKLVTFTVFPALLLFRRTFCDSGLSCGGVKISWRARRYIPSRDRASRPNISRLIIVITATFYPIHLSPVISFPSSTISQISNVDNLELISWILLVAFNPNVDFYFSLCLSNVDYFGTFYVPIKFQFNFSFISR